MMIFDCKCKQIPFESYNGFYISLVIKGKLEKIEIVNNHIMFSYVLYMKLSFFPAVHCREERYVIID